jgi:hypothetical protein
MPDPKPLNPTRHTAEAMKDDALVMAGELRSLLGANPGLAQWRAAESLALGILSAVRKGRTAATLVAAADQAHAARLQQHEDAMVMHLDRMGMHDTAEIASSPQLHPIFDGICRAAGLQ